MSITNSIFQLTFPDGWKETTVYTFEGPHDSGVQHNLVLVVDPFIKKDTELKDYAQAQIAGPKKFMPGFEMVSEKDKMMPDGTPAYEIVFKYIPAESMILFQKQIYMRKEGKAFIFTATFSKKTLSTIAYQIDNVISSFRLFKPVDAE
ncbi:MAG: DcrB-related protein [Chitinivibrionales bacterium]